MLEEQKRRVAVIGASRGLGRGVAIALSQRGWAVQAIARSQARFEELGAAAPDITRGDATDREKARQTLAAGLDAFVLVAGAQPALGPISTYEWEDFRIPFDVDVKATLVWLQAALRSEHPPKQGIVFSSGAAMHGSPLSGGYAGAKHTQRFLCRYAQAEARERGLNLRIRCVLPQLNPNTALGEAGVRAYAKKAGITPEAFVRERFGESPLDPDKAGAAIVKMLETDEYNADEVVFTGAGPRPLG